MKFKLPNLGKIVSVDKKLDDEAPQKLIHVIDGHAIVNNNIVAIVNIREYVKKECSIVEEDDLDRLTGIVDWMNGKSFTKDFWGELTNESYISLTPDGIEIENNSYNKVLVYEDVPTENETMLTVVRDNLKRDPATVDRIAVNGKLLTLLSDVFKNEMKGDSYLFDFSGKENALKYSGKSKDYIFGFIPLTYNDSIEITAFLNVKDFASVLDKFLP